MTRRPTAADIVHICDTDKVLELPLNTCCVSSEPTDVTLNIGPLDEDEEFTLTYDSFQCEPGAPISFIFGDLFYDLEEGRYRAEIHEGMKVCYKFQIDKTVPCATNFAGHSVKEDVAFTDETVPAGVAPVYEDIYTFSEETATEWAAGNTTLPVDTSTLATLCDEPFELVVQSAICSEHVLVTPDNGTLSITRGSGGTRDVKHPAGATIAFRWTPFNVNQAVTAAQLGANFAGTVGTAIVAADILITLGIGMAQVVDAVQSGKAVYLTLSDGTNREVILAHDTYNGQLLVTRAQEGTTAQDWPVDTCVSFAKVEDQANIVTSQSTC